jgi:DNA-binding beta-propeller fold protein YncE
VVVGAVVQRRPLCGERELATGLALGERGDGSGRALVYAGVWAYADSPGSEMTLRNARIVALDAGTGAVVASLQVGSTPTHLALARAPQGAGARLYVLEGDSGGDAAARDRWRLDGLDPLTLQQESAIGLGDEVRTLSVTPDGRTAYGLGVAGRTLVQVDLVSGDQRALSLPDWGQDVLATNDRVYVANAFGNTLWVVDRRSGRTRLIAVGPHPIALAFHGA